MTGIKKKIALLMVLMIMIVSAAGCSLIEKSPEAIAKEKVAKVGSEYITRGELEEIVNYQVENIKAQYGYDDNYFTSDQGKETLVQIKKDILNSLIEQKVMEQKSKELNLFKDEKEITDETNKTIDEQIKNGKSDEEFNKWLSDAHLTQELLVKLARMQVIAGKVYDNVTKDVVVTDDEIKNYYNMNQTSFTEKPNTMNVSHILLKTEDEAKKIKERLDKGEDFATLAKEYSIEEAAKTTGGDLGEIQYNDSRYDQTFVLAAMALKEGQISNPVSTQFGYHIIKVTKKTEYPVLPLDKVKEDIKTTLTSDKKNEAYSKAIEDWKAKAGTKILDKELSE